MSDLVETKSGLIRVSGVNLHYELAGTGPALVLIHTGLADSRMFDAQFTVFARHCRVLRYDLPGFGRSGWPTQPYTQHGVLRELLDRLAIEHAVLLGTSLGGSVALDFTLVFPAMVDALITVAAGISGYPETTDDQRLFEPVVTAFKANDYSRAIDLMMHIWVDGPSRGIDEVDPALRERVRTLYTDVLLRSREAGRPADRLEPPAYGRLNEIDVPALVLVGEGDIPSIQDQAELIHGAIAGSQFVVLPKVAHLLNMEVPDELNRLLLEFLQEHHLAT